MEVNAADIASHDATAEALASELAELRARLEDAKVVAAEAAAVMEANNARGEIGGANGASGRA
eukprot:4076123-Pyramimonas_sp.AAC.1